MRDPRRQQADEVLNQFCDRDANWGPLLFLRPDRDRPLDSGRVAAGSIILGSSFGVAGSIVLALAARHVGHDVPSVYLMPLILVATYFLAARFTIAAAWNRRAALLRVRAEREDRYG